MHGTSHWIGSDVHDVGRYFDGEAPRVFAPGMAITVEPGVYVPINDESVDPIYRGIGIRIEDDILITEEGNEVLTDSAPKTVAEIEAVVGQHPLK
jgi:Xaa-Pro aminopeptidase